MNIYERFLALPRARKGTVPVVVVEEDVLRRLIYDATWRHPEVSEQFRQQNTVMKTFTAVGPPAVQPAVLIEESRPRPKFRAGW